MTAVMTGFFCNCCEFRLTTAAVLHEGECYKPFRATFQAYMGKVFDTPKTDFQKSIPLRSFCISPDGWHGRKLFTLKGQEVTKWKLLIELRMTVVQYYCIINIY